MAWSSYPLDDGPWTGLALYSPTVPSAFLLIYDEPTTVPVGPPTSRKAERFDLCQFFPDHVCDDDNDVDVGGTGDHHRLISLFEDVLFGSANQTGLLDDVESIAGMFIPAEMPERYLDALLLHVGFNLAIPLTTSDKRRIIPALVALYKRKGTNPGIEEALTLLLGIPVELFPTTGEGFAGLEFGETFSLTVSEIVTASEYVRVDHPERFEIGKNIVVVDRTNPFVAFTDTEILDIQSDRIYFAPQTLSGTIEVGAEIFCDRYSDQFDIHEMGPDPFSGGTDPDLYGFYVDVQRTVTTMTHLDDGGTSVELTSVDFILRGTRVQITDTTAPTNAVIVVTVTSIVGNVIYFESVSLTQTIEAGAEAINLFTDDEITIIDEIVKFAKLSYTHHLITRDEGEEVATIG